MHKKHCDNANMRTALRLESMTFAMWELQATQPAHYTFFFGFDGMHIHAISHFVWSPVWIVKYRLTHALLPLSLCGFTQLLLFLPSTRSYTHCQPHREYLSFSLKAANASSSQKNKTNYVQHLATFHLFIVLPHRIRININTPHLIRMPSSFLLYLNLVQNSGHWIYISWLYLRRVTLKELYIQVHYDCFERIVSIMYLIMSICFSLCVNWISVPPTNSCDFLGNQFYYTEYRPQLFCWGRTPSANTIGSTGITFNISSISSFISFQYLWSTVPQDMHKDHLWVGSFSKTRAMEKLYKMFRFLKNTHFDPSIKFLPYIATNGFVIIHTCVLRVQI